MIPCKEQFSGCLIGQCLGDATGFPVEGYAQEACKKYVEETLKTGHAEDRGRGHFPFGQYTDDSQLARELLQSYAECRRFDPRNYAGRIASIFSEKRIVGAGRATAEAAERLSRGISWEKAGTLPPSAGNGSAMRAGPVGLMFFDNPEGLIKSAYDQGRITHQDRRCSAGAVAIAGAVALALQADSIDSRQFLFRLSEWAHTIEHTVSSALLQLIEWISLPPDEAVKFISKAGLGPGYYDEWHGISPFVTGSVLWSLYSFLRSRGNYLETIRTAVAVGGDVDTTAAMAGAVSGAYLGLKAIPLQLSQRLTDQGTWGLDELIGLAYRCHDLKMEQMMRGKML